MTHKEIAEELAKKEYGQPSSYWVSSYKPELWDLRAVYSSYTAERLLDALERFKAWLGTSEVDDLISAAEKNLSDLTKETTLKTVFKPSKAASVRTKNRFKEHSLELSGNDKEGRRSSAIHGMEGVECILFASKERDKVHRNSPRWMGWIPANEVEKEGKK